MPDDKGINRQYRDRLFKFIFGNPDNKEWTLSLYNAINGSHYTDANAIVFNTIDDVLYMNMKNDVSFLVNDIVNLYEQQSTFNPNMPMRFLMYAGMIYSRFIQENETYDIYSTKLQRAPLPKCICFYNGVSKQDDVTVLKLTNAFGTDNESDIEVRVSMININYGNNTDLLNSCKPLLDYAFFIHQIRINKETMPIELAIEKSLENLPADSIIKPFLLANKAEVKMMCITEYDDARHVANERIDAQLEILVGLIKDGIISIADAAKRINMSVSEFKSKTGLK